MEDGVADVGDERLELPINREQVSVVVDPDAAAYGGEQLALDCSGGGREQSIGPSHEVEVAQDGLGVFFTYPWF